MIKERIAEIESKFKLETYLLHVLCGETFDNLIETVSLGENIAGSVIIGTAPISERREIFLKIYDGIKRIAEEIKKD